MRLQEEVVQALEGGPRSAAYLIAVVDAPRRAVLKALGTLMRKGVVTISGKVPAGYELTGKLLTHGNVGRDRRSRASGVAPVIVSLGRMLASF